VAQVFFKERALSEIRLHPVDLGLSSGKRSMRGRPVLASGDVADDILSRFETYSKPLGTTIEREAGFGVVRFA
jgi:hypothetical protein